MPSRKTTQAAAEAASVDDARAAVDAPGAAPGPDAAARGPGGTDPLIGDLRRAGLLRDGPAPPPPAIEPPPVGRWTVGAASIEQDDEGPIVARIDGGLCVEFIQSFGEYEVRAYRGEIELNVTGMHATFGEAVEAAADAGARMELGAALTHDDVAGFDFLAAVDLDAQILRVGVAAVAGGAEPLLVRHVYFPLMLVISMRVSSWR